MRVELLWFEGCANHELAEATLRDVLSEGGAPAHVTRIQIEDEEAGNRVGFPGSPTIRIDGVDIEPGFADCEDCTPGVGCIRRRRGHAACRSASGSRSRATTARSLAREPMVEHRQATLRILALHCGG